MFNTPPFYHIIINEEQRLALMELIKANPQLCGDDAPLAYWDQMLEDLPKEEKESPGIQHGFCL